MLIANVILGGIFMTPLDIPNNWTILLWSIPLIIIIATVYKATKLEKVTDLRFVKESAGLSVTIIGFMALIAVGLWIAMAILT